MSESTWRLAYLEGEAETHEVLKRKIDFFAESRRLRKGLRQAVAFADLKDFFKIFSHASCPQR